MEQVTFPTCNIRSDRDGAPLKDESLPRGRRPQDTSKDKAVTENERMTSLICSVSFSYFTAEKNTEH